MTAAKGLRRLLNSQAGFTLPEMLTVLAILGTGAQARSHSPWTLHSPRWSDDILRPVSLSP